MRHRSPARWLAPLALFATIMAVAAVIGQGLRSDEVSPSAGGGTPAATTRTVADGRASGERRTRRRTYRVRSGDTLSGISVRTGVPLERLRRLNPDLDLDSLQTGQRIRLAP